MTVKHPRQQRPGRTRGVSLLFALLALVTLSLAAVALVRSVDTSALVMGNLGFKRDATAVADQATQQAITALTALADRTIDSSENAAKGYYATAHASIDATGHQQTLQTRELIDWDGDGCKYSSDADTATCNLKPRSDLADINGNKVRYVILRLCDAAGDPTTTPSISCVRPPAVAGAPGTTDEEIKAACEAAQAARGEIKYGTTPLPCTGIASGSSSSAYQGIYYRIVVRVIGARNTSSFTETIVHL